MKQEDFDKIADIRRFLLLHPDQGMIKQSCLHYLGDEHQKFDALQGLKKEEQELWCCLKCGLTDIETKYWVNVNTHAIQDTCSDGETEDNFCNNCGEHTNFISK